MNVMLVSAVVLTAAMLPATVAAQPAWGQPGYARPQPVVGVAVEVPFGPPALRHEVPTQRPVHGRNLWAAGHWRWDGSAYQWNPGRWQEPPSVGMTWAAPRWEHHGQGWMMNGGDWRPGPGARGGPMPGRDGRGPHGHGPHGR